jgi:hypothetical protein
VTIAIAALLLTPEAGFPAAGAAEEIGVTTNTTSGVEACLCAMPAH